MATDIPIVLIKATKEEFAAEGYALAYLSADENGNITMTFRKEVK